MRRPALSIVLLLSPLLVYAADVEQGKHAAARCVSCHGQAGISANPLYPNLAGQKEAYLLKQMRDFQTGKRPDPIMGAMVKGLSDQDLANLAAYYNQLK